MEILNFSKGKKTALIYTQFQQEALALLAFEPAFWFFSLCDHGMESCLNKIYLTVLDRICRSRRWCFRISPYPALKWWLWSQWNSMQNSCFARILQNRPMSTIPKVKCALLPWDAFKKSWDLHAEKSLSSLVCSTIPSSCRVHTIPQAGIRWLSARAHCFGDCMCLETWVLPAAQGISYSVPINFCNRDSFPRFP